MNVYDFDKTIYHVDSTTDFVLYAMRKYPPVLIYLPKILVNLALFGLKLKERGKAKESILSFFRILPDAEGLIEKYWDSHMNGFHKWYLAQKRADDVISSASPDIIVAPACRRLGLTNVIATKMDPETAKFLTPNNHDKQKVTTFREAFGDAVIDEFYSDSRSDDPLAQLAKKSFLVKGETLVPW